MLRYIVYISILLSSRNTDKFSWFVSNYHCFFRKRNVSSRNRWLQDLDQEHYKPSLRFLIDIMSNTLVMTPILDIFYICWIKSTHCFVTTALTFVHTSSVILEIEADLAWGDLKVLDMSQHFIRKLKLDAFIPMNSHVIQSLALIWGYVRLLIIDKHSWIR